MSAYTRPMLLSPDGTRRHLLERLPLTASATRRLSERWFQDALFAAPETLPIAELDPGMGPLVPVCTELETGAGPADILFVTPAGQLVLVETKLWRNPEARREVVGQLLDYAKQLTTWSYDVLDQKASMAAKAPRGHLLRCVKTAFPETDEVAFVDGVARSLKIGDFLLLVIGDASEVAPRRL